MERQLTEFINKKLKQNSRVPRATRELIVSIVTLAYQLGAEGAELTAEQLDGRLVEDKLIEEFLKNNEVKKVGMYYDKIKRIENEKR